MRYVLKYSVVCILWWVASSGTVLSQGYDQLIGKVRNQQIVELPSLDFQKSMSLFISFTHANYRLVWEATCLRKGQVNLFICDFSRQKICKMFHIGLLVSLNDLHIAIAAGNLCSVSKLRIYPALLYNSSPI